MRYATARLMLLCTALLGLLLETARAQARSDTPYLEQIAQKYLSLRKLPVPLRSGPDTTFQVTQAGCSDVLLISRTGHQFSSVRVKLPGEESIEDAEVLFLMEKAGELLFRIGARDVEAARDIIFSAGLALSHHGLAADAAALIRTHQKTCFSLTATKGSRTEAATELTLFFGAGAPLNIRRSGTFWPGLPDIFTRIDTLTRLVEAGSFPVPPPLLQEPVRIRQDSAFFDTSNNNGFSGRTLTWVRSSNNVWRPLEKDRIPAQWIQPKTLFLYPEPHFTSVVCTISGKTSTSYALTLAQQRALLTFIAGHRIAFYAGTVQPNRLLLSLRTNHPGWHHFMVIKPDPSDPNAIKVLWMPYTPVLK